MKQWCMCLVVCERMHLVFVCHFEKCTIDIWSERQNNTSHLNVDASSLFLFAQPERFMSCTSQLSVCFAKRCRIFMIGSFCALNRCFDFSQSYLNCVSSLFMLQKSHSIHSFFEIITIVCWSCMRVLCFEALSCIQYTRKSICQLIRHIVALYQPNKWTFNKLFRYVFFFCSAEIHHICQIIFCKAMIEF